MDVVEPQVICDGVDAVKHGGDDDFDIGLSREEACELFASIGRAVDAHVQLGPSADGELDGDDEDAR